MNEWNKPELEELSSIETFGGTGLNQDGGTPAQHS